MDFAGFYGAAGISSIRSGDIANADDLVSLSLAGLKIDHVIFVSPVLFFEMEADPGEMLRWLEEVEERAFTTISVPHDTLRHDLAITLIGGTDAQAQPTGFEYASRIDSFKQYIQDTGSLPALTWAGYTGPHDLYCYRRSLASACVNHCFFTTSSGKIGLGPAYMKPDDQLVVLQGGLWPFILRTHGNEYQLIGECYVHGIMFG